MICSQCRKPYQRDATVALGQSLFGLCERCGSVSRFQPFVNDAGATAACVLLSVEFGLLSVLLHGWRFFATAVLSTAAVYAVFLAVVRQSPRRTHRNEDDRRKAERLERVLGSILGLMIGVTWLWVALKLDPNWA